MKEDPNDSICQVSQEKKLDDNKPLLVWLHVQKKYQHW